MLNRVRSTWNPWNGPHIQHPPFTAWTTRVSNPVRSPRFRSSASVTAQRPAFAIGVLPDIYIFHRYTGNPSLPIALSPPVPGASTVKRWTFTTGRDEPPTSPLRLIIPDNACTLRYYRGCWHVVSRCLFNGKLYLACSLIKRGLQPEGLHPSRGVAASGLRPLCNIPHCCLL